MKQQHAVIVLFLMIIASSFTSLGSYKTTSRMVSEDMDRALALALEEQQSDVISEDTVQIFNSYLQITGLRGKATLAVDTNGKKFQAYARCSEATIFLLSDQRAAAILWIITGCWTIFVCYRRRQTAVDNPYFILCSTGNSFGGLTYSETDNHFYAVDGRLVQLTPMQHQLMEMFFQSPTHSLTKKEICDALWPKKPDASETLYTMIRRLKPVVAHNSKLRIESDRCKSYRLIIK